MKIGGPSQFEIRGDRIILQLLELFPLVIVRLTHEQHVDLVGHEP